MDAGTTAFMLCCIVGLTSMIPGLVIGTTMIGFLAASRCPTACSRVAPRFGRAGPRSTVIDVQRTLLLGRRDGV